MRVFHQQTALMKCARQTEQWSQRPPLFLRYKNVRIWVASRADWCVFVFVPSWRRKHTQLASPLFAALRSQPLATLSPLFALISKKIRDTNAERRTRARRMHHVATAHPRRTPLSQACGVASSPNKLSSNHLSGCAQNELYKCHFVCGVRPRAVEIKR